MSDCGWMDEKRKEVDKKKTQRIDRLTHPPTHPPSYLPGGLEAHLQLHGFARCEHRCVLASKGVEGKVGVVEDGKGGGGGGGGGGVSAAGPEAAFGDVVGFLGRVNAEEEEEEGGVLCVGGVGEWEGEVGGWVGGWVGRRGGRGRGRRLVWEEGGGMDG